MLSIGFRCVLGHFRRFQVCVILRVGMRMVSEIRLCSLRPEYFARDCCMHMRYTHTYLSRLKFEVSATFACDHILST